MVKYSVIVCSYNGSRWIGECLDALAAQRLPKDLYEVIVVDDGSTDSLSALVRPYEKRYANFRLISYSPNKGLSAARNIGWQNAKGGIIYYIDDDAVADPDWIERLASHYASENIAGVGGYPRPYFEKSLYTIYDIARCKLEYGDNAEVLNDNNWGSGGCNMSLRRSVLDEVGGFDPRFRAVADDADINKRIAGKGYRLLCAADITVRHRYPTSFKDFYRKRAGRGRGELIYDRKYGNKNIALRSLAGIAMAALNLPKNLAAGFSLSKRAGRYDLFLAFSILYPLDKIFVKYGKLKSALSSR